MLLVVIPVLIEKDAFMNTKRDCGIGFCEQITLLLGEAS